MSEPLRIAAAVEGPTDAIVLRAALNCFLRNKADFVFETLQPEGSVAFGSTAGTGWGGVYRWARQSAKEGGGSVSGSTALSFHDLLIVQVDADVAGKTYASASILDPPCQDLPCQQPCPPPNNTTNALRTVILRWLGEARCPAQVVLCTPSQSIETWVIAAVWPGNLIIRRGNWECHQNPEGQLGALPLRQRFRKAVGDYRDRQEQITLAWPNLSATLTEAARFETEFLAAHPSSPL